MSALVAVVYLPSADKLRHRGIALVAQTLPVSRSSGEELADLVEKRGKLDVGLGVDKTAFGYLQAIRRAQEGKPPAPWTIFSGLRPQPGSPMRSLLVIGLMNATASALALLATMPVDGGQWVRMLTSAAPAPTRRSPPTAAGGLTPRPEPPPAC